MTLTVATPAVPLPGPLADPNAEAPCIHCGVNVYRCWIGMGPLYRHVDTEHATCNTPIPPRHELPDDWTDADMAECVAAEQAAIANDER